MAQQTLIVIEVVIRQFVSDEMALGVTRVIAVDLWKGLAEHRGQLYQRSLLLRCEVVLHEFVTLDVSVDRRAARGPRDEIPRAETRFFYLSWETNPHSAIRVLFVPVIQGLFFIRFKRADIRDLDAHGPAVGCRRMPRPLLDVQRLVNGPVQVEHEMDAQVTHIVQHLETLPAGAARIEMINELVDHTLQQRQIPSSTTDPLSLLGGQPGTAQPVAIGGGMFEILERGFGCLTDRLGDRLE